MKTGNKITTKDVTFMGFSVALLAIFSWITIPATVPFTLQTMGIFLILIVLGGGKGTLSILGYLLLGGIGVPVFAGFSGGVGSLIGPTGGYLVGFLLTGIVYLVMEKIAGTSYVVKVIALVIGLAVCYLFGTLWFVKVYSATNAPIGFQAALSICVLPFLIFDIVKLIVAIIAGRRINRIVQNAQ